MAPQFYAQELTNLAQFKHPSIDNTGTAANFILFFKRRVKRAWWPPRFSKPLRGCYGLWLVRFLPSPPLLPFQLFIRD